MITGENKNSRAAAVLWSRSLVVCEALAEPKILLHYILRTTDNGGQSRFMAHSSRLIAQGLSLQNKKKRRVIFQTSLFCI